MPLSGHIPVLETERMILRGPRPEDAEVFVAFLASERARFVGGPIADRKTALRAFGHAAGLWTLRGYGTFVGEARDGRPVGAFGPWFPLYFTEPEFGWSVWDPAFEGQGYVTEAMRALIPWTWAETGLTTAISIVDEGNDGSARVAERLGAVLDAQATEAANRPDSPHYLPDGPRARVFRHRRAA